MKFLELSPSSEKMAELRKLADGGDELDDAMADIMDWLTDDVDWITGQKHDAIRLVYRQ